MKSQKWGQVVLKVNTKLSVVARIKMLLGHHHETSPWAIDDHKRKPASGPSFIQLYYGRICANFCDFNFKALLTVSTQNGIVTFRCLLHDHDWRNSTNPWTVNVQDGRLIFLIICEIRSHLNSKLCCYSNQENSLTVHVTQSYKIGPCRCRTFISLKVCTHN